MREIDPVDRNKTTLTHKITALACGYISSLGCKPVETEVPISGYGIIDVASFAYPTMTEMKLAKIFKKIFPEFTSFRDHIKHSAYIERFGQLTLVGVEVKVTPADFQRDLGRKYSNDWGSHKTPPTHWGYLAVPKSLEEKAKPIISWGKIICAEDGERILKVDPPSYVTALHPGSIADIVAAIAIRREHRTAYRAHRDFFKHLRLEKARRPPREREVNEQISEEALK